MPDAMKMPALERRALDPIVSAAVDQWDTARPYIGDYQGGPRLHREVIVRRMLDAILRDPAARSALREVLDA